MKNSDKQMNVNLYSTGTYLGTATVNEEAYGAYLAQDTTATGAVKAMDWLSAEDIVRLGIQSDSTVWFD